MGPGSVSSISAPLQGGGDRGAGEVNRRDLIVVGAQGRFIVDDVQGQGRLVSCNCACAARARRVRGVFASAFTPAFCAEISAGASVFVAGAGVSSAEAPLASSVVAFSLPVSEVWAA